MNIDFKKDVKPLLDAGVTLASTAAAAVPGPVGVVIQLVAAALKFGSDVAAQGLDPVTSIQRIHAQDPLLKDVEGSWAQALDAKFGKAK